MTNHVSDLEATVTQLSATVEGLQEELVDANERIRALEQELDTASEDTSNTAESVLLSPPDPEEPTETAETETQTESESSEQSADDIIVA